MSPKPNGCRENGDASDDLRVLLLVGVVFLPCFPARSRPVPLIKEAIIIPGGGDRSGESLIDTDSGRPVDTLSLLLSG